MTFTAAAKAQYRHATYYTFWLVSPQGEREQIGITQRKSGDGLIAVLRRVGWEALVTRIPDLEETTMKKRADRILWSNGWSAEFGGTIREEAAG